MSCGGSTRAFCRRSTGASRECRAVTLWTCRKAHVGRSSAAMRRCPRAKSWAGKNASTLFTGYDAARRWVRSHGDTGGRWMRFVAAIGCAARTSSAKGRSSRFRPDERGPRPATGCSLLPTAQTAGAEHRGSALTRLTHCGSCSIERAI